MMFSNISSPLPFLRYHPFPNVVLHGNGKLVRVGDGPLTSVAAFLHPHYFVFQQELHLHFAVCEAVDQSGEEALERCERLVEEEPSQIGNGMAGIHVEYGGEYVRDTEEGDHDEGGLGEFSEKYMLFYLFFLAIEVLRVSRFALLYVHGADFYA